MPRRRQDKRITKYKLKNGFEGYQIKAYLGTDPATGKQIRITRRGYETYSDAEQALSGFLADRGQGVTKVAKEKANRKTVDEVWQLWWPLYFTTVKESTAAQTLNVYINHIKPVLGDYYINRIPPDKLQSYATQLAQEFSGYKNVLAHLRQLIKFAMVQGYADKNPFDRVIIPKNSPKRKTNRKNYYEKDELAAFLKSAKEINPKFYTYFLLLGTTGLRQGEASALQWPDIDFKNRLLTVRRTLAHGLNSRQLIQTPKTKQSYRTVPISQHLSDTLLAYQDWQTNKLGLRKYIFSGFYDRPPRPSNVYVWQNRVLKNAPGLRKITIHGFRHSFASLLIESDSSIKPTDLQHLLGHASVNTSLSIYTHATKVGKDNVTNAINHLGL